MRLAAGPGNTRRCPAGSPAVMTAMRCCLASGPRKSCGQPERAAQHADVGRHRGGQRRQPAEPGSADGVTQRHDEQRVRDAIRHLVVEHADLRFPAAFDGHHAVQQIAQQPQLDAGRAGQQIPGLPAAAAAPPRPRRRKPATASKCRRRRIRRARRRRRGILPSGWSGSPAGGALRSCSSCRHPERNFRHLSPSRSLAP